ncbi:hypothetical protein CJ030_MR2G002971 [Morella rubra]|uniref:Uncharacterized protein n=1 Tax=Morella rubra TaxID=262757 RepID=A0A6A1WD64_9ROSI|nr:hypothetical protein CJ030_MR2G002971 [Morella rubra]
MANVGGSSSGAARVPKAPERREGRWGPSQLVETDFEAFYTEYHFPRETHFRLPSANETPYTDGVKGEMCFFEAPLKSGRRASPPLGVSEAEEEEAEEAPLARLEDVSPMLSPTSGVRTEIPVPAVKAHTQSFSLCVVVAALDAAELKHDEELESSRLKLRKLEGDLESQRKLVEELRTVARGTHLQMQTYEARVMDLERDIASRDIEVAELREKRHFGLNWWALTALCVRLLIHLLLRREVWKEARTGLTLRVAELSAVPAFPGDPEVLARRCIGVAMAVLEVAYLREGVVSKSVKKGA